MNKHFFAFIFVLAAALLVPSPSHALTVSPPTMDYSFNAGDSLRDVIKLHNEGEAAITLYPQVYNFTSKEGDDQLGTPDFYPGDEIRNGHELAPWITIDKKPITLLPGERLSVDFFVNVPRDAQPGSHFGSIHLKSSPDEQAKDGTVSLIGGVGVLVFGRVSGEATESLTVSRFDSPKKVYTHLPVDLQIRLENDGNTHLRPTGNIFITNIFGRQVKDLPVNPDFRSVLPDSARRFETTWFRRQIDASASEFIKQWKNFAFGRYKATLVMTYGTKNVALSATTNFWVIPWMVLLVLFGGAAALIVLLRFGLRAYARRAIAEYERRKNTP